MTTDLFINPSSQAIIDRFLKDLPQSLLLEGPYGVGLSAISTYIANSLRTTAVVVLPEKDEKVNVETGTITVDSIRRLYDQTRTIQDKIHLIVIDYAERMGIQAQNAFLKLLEEPGANVHFILVTHQPGKLLPTIRSRTQSLVVKPISREQSLRLLEQLSITDDQKKTQLLFMAEGLPAELVRLSSDQSYFERRTQIVRDARALLQADTYARLQVAQRYKDSRPEALLLLKDAGNILRRSIMVQPEGSLIQRVNGLLNTYDKIEANGNIRLCLARLVL